MGRLRLVIADSDPEYVANFEKFLLVNYPQRFELLSFASPEKLSKYIDNSNSPDFFMASGEMIAKVPRIRESGKVLLLSGDESGCVPEGLDKVEKYQHMDQLVSEIMRHYTDMSRREHMAAGRKSTCIVSVYSPCGGTGKSCIAAGCSMLYAGKGLKSFYLNLEDVPSTELFFHGDSRQTFSNVIFYLKGKDSNISLKIESAKCVDAGTGVHFFRPPVNMLEMNELTEQDVIRLINGIRDSAAYDIVFADMSAGLNQCNAAVLRCSDVILLVLTPGSRMSVKLKEFRTAVDFLEHKWQIKLGSRVVPVLNSIHGTEGNISDYCLYDEYRPLAEIAACKPASTENRQAGNYNPVENVDFMRSLADIAGFIIPCAGTSVPYCFGGDFIACR